VGKEDSAAVLRLLETEDFRFQVVKEEDLPTCAVLLDLAGRTDELDVMLEQALTQALRRGFSPSRYKEEIGEVAQLYRQLGRWRQFEERARESLGSREAEELLDYAERMSRRLF
jgi:hypothetical protein